MGICSSFRSLLDSVMEALGMRHGEDEGRRGSRMQVPLSTLRPNGQWMEFEYPPLLLLLRGDEVLGL